MKTKRILSFVCVLALALSLCSVFSFAAAPEAEITEASAVAPRAASRYVVKTSTYMYVNPSTTSAYACPYKLSVGTYVVSAGPEYLGYAYVTHNSYTGYIPLSRLTAVQ